MISKAEWFALTAFTLLVIYLFWPFIFAQEIVGYRDAVQFYWPMWEWTDRVWSQGEIPLWNPYDGLGRSFVADGVSAVFYPGKLIFLIRCWSIETRMGVYLAGHVWLAGVGAARLARVMRAPRWGSGLAMFSFGLSGPVLFQVTNATFLVGAAWLPWGMIAISDFRQKHSPRGPIFVALAAAMMVLGGDIQMAYHLLLIASAVWLWPQKNTKWLRKSTQPRLRAVFFAGLLSIGLSAIQFVPTFGAAWTSERANAPAIINAWRLPTAGNNKIGVFDDPELQSHHGDIYEFSQPPWTMAGLVCPNFFGRPFPIRTDWASGLPSAGACWQPSLYQGVIPIVCALGAWRLRRMRWLVSIAIVFGIGAWGWYGPIWFANELGLATGLWSPITTVGRPVGGLYWAMVTLLPGYDLFRYPAKLWVITSLCVSVIAATGLPKVLSNKKLGQILWIVGGVAASCLIATWIVDLRKSLPEDVGNDWFGPLDLDLAVQFIRSSLFQAATVACLAALTIRSFQKSKDRFISGSQGGRLALAILLILSAIDLVFANSWLLPSIARPQRAIGSANLNQSDKPASNLIAPAIWKELSSMARLEEVAKWQLETSFPRLNLLNGLRQIEAPGTLQEEGWIDFLASLVATKPEAHTVFADSDLQKASGPWLLVGPIIEPGGNLDRSIESRLRSFRGGTIETAMPDWYKGEVNDGPRILKLTPTSFFKTNQSPSLEVHLPQDGILVLQDKYTPGWGARIERLDGENRLERFQNCICVGGVFRGLVMAEGRYRIEFLYKPRDVFWGFSISCLSWGTIALYGLIWRWRTLFLKSSRHS